MNCVFIVPTGLGAEIGGHSGDATPSARLIASVCDTLVVHPNVVNASDINEMTDNMLYVEGSILDRFLAGTIGLDKVYQNKLLVAVNGEPNNVIVNAVSAARSSLGVEISILMLDEPIKMSAKVIDGVAQGTLEGVAQAIEQVRDHVFDVLVVNTPIETNTKDAINYLTSSGGVNPWGGIEAMLSKRMSLALNKPVIHSPVETEGPISKVIAVVDPRKAAELVSMSYLHCCLKGGHRAPRISGLSAEFNVNNIDFMLTPYGVWGTPHRACIKHGVQIIAVKENSTSICEDMHESVIVVGNYLEAAGVISARKAGVSLESVRRPLSYTEVL